MYWKRTKWKVGLGNICLLENCPNEILDLYVTSLTFKVRTPS